MGFKSKIIIEMTEMLGITYMYILLRPHWPKIIIRYTSLCANWKVGSHLFTDTGEVLLEKCVLKN